MRAVKGTVSMGRAGVCWDNAMAESFWATLKTEYYYRRAFTTRDQVYTGVATWIEDFYNRRRIHTSLGGTPHRIRTTPSGLDNSRINKPSTTCAQAQTVREWQKMYRVIGRGGLLAMGVKRAKYDYETKVAAARAVVDGGMSKPEAMVRFGIASATSLKKWCRLYREGGAQALKPKPKGRPKGSVRAVPPTREEELEERVRKLEAQVAYLKKSIALKAQRRSQTGTKP